MPNRFQELWAALPWRRSRSIAGNAQILRSAVNGSFNLSDTDATPTDQSAEISPPLVTGQEFGASGTQVYGGYIRQEDHNPELDDFVKAVKIYDKMRKSDAQINAMLSVLKLPLRGATWTCVPPTDGDEVDQQIADYVNSCIFEDDAMELGWDYTLRHILLQLDYGFSVFETVWEVDESGAYRIKRLAPRLARTVRKWHTERNGRLRAIEQYAPVPIPHEKDVTQAALYRSRVDNSAAARYSYQTNTKFQWLTIPSDYLAVFSLGREGDNYEGISVLRTVYRNWYYKDQAYNLEGVRLDRFGVGIPVAKLEESHTLTQQDLESLVEVLKSVRSNERAYLIAPPGVEYKLLPETGSKTAGTGATNWINHHDQQIGRNVLAGFLTLGNDPHGTLGFGSRLTDMFISSLNGVAAGICSDLKTQVVKKLCFTPDTRITMADGTRKPIVDVHVGDSVLGHDGKAHAVVDVMARPYSGQMKSIDVTGHGQIVCTPEHPFLAAAARPLWMQRRKYASHGGAAVLERAQVGPEWTEAKDLERGEYVVAPVVLTDEAVTAPSDLMARLMGAFVAEGNYIKRNGRRVGVQFTLGVADVHRGYLDQIVEDLVALGYKPAVTRSTRARAITVRVYTAPLLVDALASCGEYSHAKRLPLDVVRWPISSKRQIISAYWTGDGCFFDAGYPQAFAVTRSRDLAETLAVLLESISIPCRLTRRPPRRQSKEAWSVVVAGRHAQDLKAFIEAGECPAQARELHDKTFCVDGYHHYRIKSVVDVEHSGLVYNLEVADVHTYVANGVVVHNCDLNFDMTKRKYPRVTCRDLEQIDMSNLVQALAVLANTWIQPDDDIEKMLRKVLQLPPLKPEQKRENQQQAQAGTAAAQAAHVAPDGTPLNQPTPAEAANGNAGLPKQRPPTDAPKDTTANTSGKNAVLSDDAATNERLQTLSLLRDLAEKQRRSEQPSLFGSAESDEETE